MIESRSQVLNQLNELSFSPFEQDLVTKLEF